jgi:hypothetical protein
MIHVDMEISGKSGLFGLKTWIVASTSKIPPDFDG